MRATTPPPPANAYHVLARVLGVAGALRRRQPCNAETLAGELGASARTIKRDIQLLRSWGWDIAWNHHEQSYDLSRAPRPKLI